MTSSTSTTLDDDINTCLQPPKSSPSLSNRYSIHDHGQGYRTYSYEFDLIDYEPEQITVLLDQCGRLRIRAHRPPCHEFRREYNLGGTHIETRLVRNTIDTQGRLRVDIDARPRPYDSSLTNDNANTDNTLTFDLQGYRPKNINVRVDEKGLLKINAQHTDDTIGHRINREFYRQHQLPKNISPNQIRAKIDENQLLSIELPQSSPRRATFWDPYHGKTYSPAYGKETYGNPCCNVM